MRLRTFVISPAEIHCHDHSHFRAWAQQEEGGGGYPLPRRIASHCDYCTRADWGELECIGPRASHTLRRGLKCPRVQLLLWFCGYELDAPQDWRLNLNLNNLLGSCQFWF
jgi:hypothetical protein